MGDMDGELNSQCWTGGFAAYQTPNGYQEIALTPFRPWVGWHAFGMSSSGKKVDFYYNGIYVANTYVPNTYSSEMAVGLESHSSYNTFNYFASGMARVGSMEYYNGGSQWLYWPHPYPIGHGILTYDDYYPTVSVTYAWQKSNQPISTFYHQ